MSVESARIAPIMTGFRERGVIIDSFLVLICAAIVSERVGRRKIKGIDRRVIKQENQIR